MRHFSKTRKLIKKISPEKQERALKLLTKIEFMDEELAKLQKAVSEKGWVEEYQNGANQKGFKKSTEGEAYNTLIKNYTSAVKILNDMLPEDIEEEDELSAFMKM